MIFRKPYEGFSFCVWAREKYMPFYEERDKARWALIRIILSLFSFSSSVTKPREEDILDLPKFNDSTCDAS